MTMLNIPASLEEEHKGIMEALRRFSSFEGKTGAAVKELLEVLEPHFEKEEEVAMPVLGSLSMLVSKENYSDLNEIAASERRLEREYKNMFEEHEAIRKFIGIARETARIEQKEQVVDLLDGLAHHAKVEEEVLYPAALLAGKLARLLINSVNPIQNSRLD